MDHCLWLNMVHSAAALNAFRLDGWVSQTYYSMDCERTYYRNDLVFPVNKFAMDV